VALGVPANALPSVSIAVSKDNLETGDVWMPTSENINALPLPLRQYIHDLQTEVDPAGTLRQNFILKRENEFLGAECQRLAKERPSS